MENTPKTRKKITKRIPYTKAIGAEICTRIVNDEDLTAICEDEHIPSKASVLSWLSKGATGDKKYVELLDLYRRAREASAEAVDSRVRRLNWRMEQPRTIPNPAHDAVEAAKDKAYSEPATIPNPDYLDPQAGQAISSNEKWRAAHLKPHVYGNRVEVAHSGTVKHDHTHKVDPPDWIKAEIEQDDAPAMIEVEAREVETVKV